MAIEDLGTSTGDEENAVASSAGNSGSNNDFSTIATERSAELLGLIEATDQIVLVTSATGVIEYANPAADDVLRRHVQPASVAQLFSEESLEVLRGAAGEAVRTGGKWSGELAILVSDDEQECIERPVAVDMIGHHNRDADTLTHISLLIRDITEHKRAETSLRNQATRDALTGLPNRAMLMEHLAAALARGQRTGLMPAVMFLDLDGFKAVNDGLGHEAGDELLIEVGRRLGECVRNTDVVARFGGDEFVILLDNISDLEMAQQIADRIITRVEEPVALSSGTGNVGTSIGISLPSVTDIEAETLLGEADTAMYQAKQLGKRRHQYFDDDLRKRAAARDLLKEQLEGAIANQEFWVMYTPVAGVAEGELRSFEAGLRWDHPTRGLLGPSEFMVLAREVGVARDLDRLVIEDAVRYAHDWNVGLDYPRTVWLTVGVQDLLSGELQSVIASAIESVGVAPGSLGIEIPLVTLTKHPAEAFKALQALNYNGVRIAIDDFGTDQFSPAQLQRFYADTVKLDRRMMTSLAKEPEAVGALAAAASVCRSLGLEVVAKGVNKPEELELLQELGCTNVQGDVVSRAMRAENVVEVLGDTAPWNGEGSWPTREVLPNAMTRSQMAERMLRLRMAA